MKITGVLLTLAIVFLCGCKKDIQSKEAVRQGVIQHLAGKAGLDVGSMDVEVSSVMFRDNEAEATVSFRPKGATDPASSMSMTYTLERKGNQWVVKSKSGTAGDPHGGMPEPGEGGTMPPGHPPLGGEPPAGEKR
ncbi:MAG: hypothetical protein KIT09_34330 [Bryobacteraceae bacterium]|nr:hypothetical protein [Bryobacteraceae bacterium]